MGDKTTSNTESYKSIGGIITGHDDMFKTTISDGDQKATGHGSTPEASQENASDSWESGDTTDAGSPCYLTTACVKSKRLPDNCLELMTLRGFRDNVLMTNSAGRNAIKEYYKMAPEIVQAVNNQENAQRIWDGVYVDIRQAVSLVLSGKSNEAFEHYKKMTLRLKNNFLK
jgi:hypothetical protein